MHVIESLKEMVSRGNVLGLGT